VSNYEAFEDKASSWALPPVVLEALDARLSELKPRLAVETGSGESTRVLARHSDRVVSFEHIPEWAAHTARRLGDVRNVSIMVAPIGVVNTPRGDLPWYEGQTVPHDIDFALIDGPPCKIGRGATGFLLLPNMAEGGEVWVDDYQHMTTHPCRHNRLHVERWIEANPGWEVAELLSFDMVSLGQGGAPYEDVDRVAVLRRR
jgi:hypothetical protein